METDMWILATSSSLADADLPWINPIAIAVAVLLIITAAYFVVKAHIDKKLAKEREAMIRSQQEQELKTAQNKIRFLTNVSQQLFTPLTLIYAPSTNCCDGPETAGIPSRLTMPTASPKSSATASASSD